MGNSCHLVYRGVVRGVHCGMVGFLAKAFDPCRAAVLAVHVPDAGGHGGGAGVGGGVLPRAGLPRRGAPRRGAGPRSSG